MAAAAMSTRFSLILDREAWAARLEFYEEFENNSGGTLGNVSESSGIGSPRLSHMTI